LAVVRDGESVVLGAVQQRALLAVLVLHPGEAVSIDRLIDALWGERAPATAAKTVQVYVSRLRRALGTDVIVTEGRGYRLAVQPGQIDAGQFEALRAEGRRALAAGDPARAREQLSRALALWRGEPLADFAYQPFARSAAAGLEEARLAALEDRIEADLSLGRDGELIAEIESLVASHPLQERFRGQLMLALYRAGRQADALAAYRDTSELLREELGLEPSRHLKELERSILEHDVSLEGARRATPAPRSVSPSTCPFKGLAFFDRDDAEFFCGRERLVSDLVARLVDSSLVGILGPSGIGKSSLLRAGVLPALSAGALPGSARWRQIVMRPGEHPWAELQHALHGDRLTEALEKLAPGERIVVAVDQLEELFTLCDREDERRAFLGQLATAARDPERRVLVVLSLRADFYGRLISARTFAELLTANHVLVGPMDRDDLARVIEEPAARVALQVERALVDALVSDVTTEPGGLPLLSTALLELWRERDDGVLRYESYRKSGGVRGAVARLAETAYTRLDERDRGVARSIMLRLAAGEEGALVRRRVPFGEFENIPGGESVLASLTDARLLIVSDGEVELSHEALLREWPRYHVWLEEDRVGRQVHAHLMRSSRDWDAAGRDVSELYRGTRLAGAIDWAAQHDHELNAVERDFLQSSRLEAERRTRRLRNLVFVIGLLLIAAVIAGVIALAKQRSASSEARVALARELGEEAVNEPQLDLAMLMAREAVDLDRSPQTESTLLATLQRSPAVIDTFALPANSRPGVNGPPQLALSPDGRTLMVSRFNDSAYVAGGGVGDVLSLDARTHRLQRSRLTDFAGAVPPVFSGDGTLLAYPTQNSNSAVGAVAVRDARTGALLGKLAFDPFAMAQQTADFFDLRILIAPNRRTIYAVHRTIDVSGHFRATYLYRWSWPSGRRLSTTRIDSGAVLAVRLVDAGTRLLVVDARSVSEFDARSMQRLTDLPISAALAAPTAAAISPDGATVAIGSASGAVSFVDPTTGRARPAGGARAQTVSALIYSPDGRAVVSLGAGNQLIEWSPRTATAVDVLTAPADLVVSAAFSPDAGTLYTATPGRVFEWDLRGDRSFGRRNALGAGSPCCGPVWPLAPPLALSPDGTTVAMRLGRSTVGLFSARSMRRRASFTVRPAGTVVTTLAWSPTAPELAVGGSSGAVQLWRVNGAPRLVRPLVGLQAFIGEPEAVQTVLFSHDGRLLTAVDSAESASSPGAGELAHYRSQLALLGIWRTGDGTPVAPPRDLGLGPAHYGSLAISADGRLLAASVPDGSDIVLDLATRRILRTLHPLGADDTVSLAFAPDGTLATGTLDGIVQMWNPITGAQIAGPVTVAAGPVTSIAFDPSGRRFATTGSQDGTTKLWFTSTLQQEGTALDTGDGTTSNAIFEHGGATLLAVNSDGTASNWPVSLSAWERRACTVAGRTLTRAEWSQFVPGQPYARVCP
jgi:DNA-binding SARP family transcriptional activator/WD40 repeat protein